MNFKSNNGIYIHILFTYNYIICTCMYTVHAFCARIKLIRVYLNIRRFESLNQTAEERLERQMFYTEILKYEEHVVCIPQ